MSFQVNHNSTNITSYVLDYTRSKRICTGVGELTINLSKTYTSTINPYDTITIYENTIKKGTYFVAQVDKSLPTATISIEAQDITKQLSDYFIDDFYEITYPTTSRYWMELFMTEAGISYSFLSASEGHTMSMNTWVGRINLLEFIQQMCMENGWYFLANADNTLVIGSLDVDYSTYSQSFVDTVITDLEVSKDDKMLRNRVLVRGNADPFTNIWVTGEVKIITPWNYDSMDYRSVLITSPDVPDVPLATQLAYQLLNETKKITEIKRVQVAGFHNLVPGNLVYIQSSFYNGLGMITSIQSKVDPRGELTTLLVDERCPRLIGYYAGVGEVFIGTENLGIWKKPLKFVHDWESYNTGLTELNVTDLSIANGVKAAVANGHLYIRTPLDSGWVRQYPQTTISGILSANAVCNDCVVLKEDSTIEAVFSDDVTLSGEGRSWLVRHNITTGTEVLPIVVSGVEDISTYGIDNDGLDTHITAELPVITSGVLTEYPEGYGIQYTPGFVGWDFRQEFVMNNHPWYFPGPNSESKWYYPFGFWESVNASGILENGILKIKPIDGSGDPGHSYSNWFNNAPMINLSATSKLVIGVNHWQSSDLVEIEWNTTPPSWSSFPTHGTVESPLHQFKSYGPSYFTFEYGLPANIDTIYDPIKRIRWQGVLDWITRTPQPEDYPSGYDPDMYNGLDFIGFTDATPINPEEYPTNVPYTITSRTWYLLKYSNNEFSKVLELRDREKIEVSQSGPVILFGGDQGFNNGDLEVWFQAEPDSTDIFASGFVEDVRGTTLITEEGISNLGFFVINPASGLGASNLYYTDFNNILTSGQNYGGFIIVDGSIFYTPETHYYTLHEFHTFSGIINHIETSNYYDYPYIFVSATVSGEHVFYQKDGRKIDEPETEFILRNNYLPQSKVTVIRLDDRV